MRALLVCTVLAWASSSMAATTIQGEKAQNLIATYRQMFVLSKPGTPVDNTITYPYDVACTMHHNMALDAQDANFAIPSYSCDFGAGKLTGIKARALFEATADAFGSDSGMGQTHTEAKGLVCTIHLLESGLEKRFECTAD
jgi:hypothetical protein